MLSPAYLAHLLDPLLLAGGAGLLASGIIARRSASWWLVFLLLAMLASFSAAIVVLATGASWSWNSALSVSGGELRLSLDPIGALFLALVAFVGSAGAIYASEYWPAARHPLSAPAGRRWWIVLLASLIAVLLATNSLHFLLGWELFTVAAYFLITLDRQHSETRAAGWLYLGASHVGTLFLFAFFAALAARTGSWQLDTLKNSAPAAELAPLYWLALAGFCLKAGAFPLHVWLPSAHSNAPSHVSAILSGVTIKMGIYGLVRFSSWLPVPAGAGFVVAAVGVTSAVLGVAFALAQHDLKRLLAYHSVENIGIILIGLGFALIAVEHGHAPWGQLALAGGLLHVWNHGLFKALLFFGAGSVVHATGTREMSRLGGLWRAMPWTTALFALGAIAISGLPPLNGFVSEWLVYLGLFDAVTSSGTAALAAVIAAVLLAATGALALACFVKVCGVVFLGAPRTAAAEHAHEAGPRMRGAMALLGSACVAIGLAPVFFWPAISRAVAEWSAVVELGGPKARPTVSGLTEAMKPPESLPVLGVANLAIAVAAVIAAAWLLRKVRLSGSRRALTWDCGYAAPTSRMQYTAASFADTITDWFSWILRPQMKRDAIEATFPVAASHEKHTPETVLDHLVAPAAALAMRASTLVRRLQHGHLQSYLLYLAAGVAGLAGLVLLGESQ
jgi:hydrogenase-4 component B